jgi:P-type Mg2+ transporter
MTIAGDNVDDELVQRPRRWDIAFIRRFMIVFGIVSSVFDYLTFGILLWLQATVAQFRTGWFIESIVSASLVVLVVRSRRPFFKSQPSKLLMLATAIIVLVTALTPYLPFAGVLGFQPIPAHFYPIIALIVVAYIVTAELAKLLFYRTKSAVILHENIGLLHQ